MRKSELYSLPVHKPALQWGKDDAFVHRHSTVRDRQALMEWPAAVIAGIVTYIMWQPGLLISYNIKLTWYVLLFLGVVVWATNRFRVDFDHARPFLLFFGLQWIGSIAGIFRSPSVDQALYNSVGFLISIVTGLLLISAFSSTKGRALVLAAICVAGFEHAVVIQEIHSELGEMIRTELFGKGSDRNFMALNMVLACAILLTMFVHTRGLKRGSGLWAVARWGMMVASGFLAYSVALSFSRSGMVCLVISVAVVLYSAFRTRQKKFAFPLGVGLLLVVVIWLPRFMDMNPVWTSKLFELERIQDPGSSLYVRYDMIKKAMIIVQENPIVGVGLGMFKSSERDVATYDKGVLAHNMYLGSWAELGIFGILAYAVFMTQWVRLYISRFSHCGVLEKSVMIMQIPFLAMLTFLDVGSILWLMLLIFSGLPHVQLKRDHRLGV